MSDTIQEILNSELNEKRYMINIINQKREQTTRKLFSKKRMRSKYRMSTAQFPGIVKNYQKNLGSIEHYNRQLSKVTKTKSSYSSNDTLLKSLSNSSITKSHALSSL